MNPPCNGPVVKLMGFRGRVAAEIDLWQPVYGHEDDKAQEYLHTMIMYISSAVTIVYYPSATSPSIILLYLPGEHTGWFAQP